MTILIIHNSHRSGSSSGDDVVFKNEVQILREHGHRVISYNISNDEFDDSGIFKKIFLGLQIPWSLASYKQIKRILKKENPDIVHIHNFFPLLSPSIYFSIKSEGTPIVQTFHDFRVLCPMAFFMRNGHICEECRDYGPVRSIRYGCFKDSRIQTIPVALMLKIHKRLNTFKEKIDVYICLTESQKDIFLKEGFDANKIFIKPNPVVDTYEPEHTGNSTDGEYVVFIGRLGKEKGLETLINAWKYLKGIPLKIVGDGPDAEKIKSLAPDNIDFLGYRPHDECMKILAEAKFLVIPSICYETFGLTTVEAFSHCKPVIASNLGAMADIVKDGKTGLLFEPGNPDDLSKKVRRLWNNPEECRRMGRNARREYEDKYTPEKNYEMLMEIYESVIRERG